MNLPLYMDNILFPVNAAHAILRSKRFSNHILVTKQSSPTVLDHFNCIISRNQRMNCHNQYYCFIQLYRSNLLGFLRKKQQGTQCFPVYVFYSYELHCWITITWMKHQIFHFVMYSFMHILLLCFQNSDLGQYHTWQYTSDNSCSYV